MAEEPEAVWKLQMGSKTGGHNIGIFEPGYVTRAGGQKEAPAAMTPLFHDTDYCEKPVYMWKEREPETWSDDEDEEKKEKEKLGAFDRPKPKGARSKTRQDDAGYHAKSCSTAEVMMPLFPSLEDQWRRVQWHMEDARPPPHNMHFVGDRKEQASKYVLFEVQDNEEEAVIKVIPVDEWWRFTKAAREVKMTVKEAMEKMKKQQRGYISGNRALEAVLTATEDARTGEGDDSALTLDSDAKASRKKAAAPKVAARAYAPKDEASDPEDRASEAEESGPEGGEPNEAEPGGDAARKPAKKRGEEGGIDFDQPNAGAGGDAARKPVKGRGEEGGIDFDQVFSDDDAELQDVFSDDDAELEDVYNADVGLDSSEDETEEVKEGEAAGQKLLDKALEGGGEEGEEAEEEEAEELAGQGAGGGGKEGEEAEEEEAEEDDYTVSGTYKARMAARASPVPSETESAAGAAAAAAEPSAAAAAGEAGGRKRSAAEAAAGAGEAKRPRPAAAAQGALALTQENMILVLRRAGGKMTSKKLLSAFRHELQRDKANRALFKQLLQALVTGVDDALEGKVYKLKDIWMT
ncbi:hypothetical protein JKP88DRAFT_353939 [Tribonema minus]|uniref:Uncharacterized protein n=1 Tax=Tribonema minus TaxID=303371 RepID=A0A835Z4B4_9STRA|nr:hypothetical protein JKP88DRAFT_353939 [Tribonema minus]